MSDQSNNPFADLVMAMLAVNQWRLEQSWEIFSPLDASGLFDPNTILSMNHGQLKAALLNGGYKRPIFVVDLLCDRLFDMATKLSGEDGKKFEVFCIERNKEKLREMLLSIKGVGPKVFENFCLLRDIRTD